MKHMIYGSVLLIIAVMVIAGVMIVSGKDVRENETDKALNTAVEQSLKQLKTYGGYEIENSQELVADFQQALLMHISSDADIQVKILAADEKKGVLDVEVRAAYKTVNAKEKQTVCRKTVVLEQYSGKRNYCMAEFFMDGIIYEKYSLYPGSTIVIPRNPRKDGYEFRGWKKRGEEEWLTDNLIVENDVAFQAVFE